MFRHHTKITVLFSSVVWWLFLYPNTYLYICMWCGALVFSYNNTARSIKQDENGQQKNEINTNDILCVSSTYIVQYIQIGNRKCDILYISQPESHYFQLLVFPFIFLLLLIRFEVLSFLFAVQLLFCGIVDLDTILYLENTKIYV